MSSTSFSPPRVAPRQAPASGTHETSLFTYLQAAWGMRRMFAVLAILGAIAGFLASLGPDRFRTAASFTPTASDGGRGRFAGLAAQFGVSVGGGDAASSPGFYADLLKSSSVIDRAVERLGSSNSLGMSRDSVARLLGVEATSPAGRDRAIVARVSDAVSTEVRRETGIVVVELTLQDAALAHRMLDGMLGSMNDFIIEMRQQRASAERRYSEQQLANAERELRAAERRQLDFLVSNRGNFRSSPTLALQHERISRDVDMRQQVYTSLAQGYEQARLDELRSTPLISIIESPTRPLEPLPRRRPHWVIAGMLVGLLIGVGLSIIIQFIRDEAAFARQQSIAGVA